MGKYIDVKHVDSPQEAGSRNSILATKHRRTCIIIRMLRSRGEKIQNVKDIQYITYIYGLDIMDIRSSYMQNEIRPSIVMTGSASALDDISFI